MQDQLEAVDAKVLRGSEEGKKGHRAPLKPHKATASLNDFKLSDPDTKSHSTVWDKIMRGNTKMPSTFEKLS